MGLSPKLFCVQNFRRLVNRYRPMRNSVTLKKSFASYTWFYLCEWVRGPQGFSLDIMGVSVSLNAHVLTWAIAKYWEKLKPQCPPQSHSLFCQLHHVCLHWSLFYVVPYRWPNMATTSILLIIHYMTKLEQINQAVCNSKLLVCVVWYCLLRYTENNVL